MKHALHLRFLIVLLSIWLFVDCSSKKTVRLESPNGAFVYTFNVHEETSELSYSITFDGEVIIGKSGLGFTFNPELRPEENILIQHVETQSTDAAWTPVYGERDEYPDIYNEALIVLSGNPHDYSIRVRAYNEGVAFRYEFTKGGGDVHIEAERTVFNVPPNANAWVSDRAQSEIEKIPVSSIERAKDRPVLLEYSDTLFVAIGEAALVNYARMKLKSRVSGSGYLESQLDGDVQLEMPGVSPWRFVMAARKPGELIENNYLLLNLNKLCEIENTSWIQPGKVIREVTLTTQGGLACVDFAVRHHLLYVEFDAGWYGHEYDTASDATTVTVDPNRSRGPLDLPKVIKYAESKGVGIILYVNMRALVRQLDELLPLVKSWGVKGVKYGFVNVGSQHWTAWLHEAVRKAADHELMVDVHDEYRPTGYSRTYPNLMTQEGIRGDEESPDNAMVLNTLFTRMISGAGDHTICYFAPRVHETMGSHTSQLAKTVCIYSPWQFLYWYDRPKGSRPEDEGAGGSTAYIEELPELTFFDQLPTTWDHTRILEGYPGEYVVVARRSEKKWFVGALNGTDDRGFEIKLDFLDPGVNYNATLFSDDASLQTRTNVKMEQVILDHSDVIEKSVLKLNGLALILDPIQ